MIHGPQICGLKEKYHDEKVVSNRYRSVPGNRDSVAILAKNSLLIRRRFSTLLPEYKYLLFVAEPFDTQGYDSDLAIGHDIGKSPNLSRSRIGWHQHSSHAYGQDRGYPSVHLPKRWSVQQDRWHIQEVVSSQVFSFRKL